MEAGEQVLLRHRASIQHGEHRHRLEEVDLVVGLVVRVADVRELVAGLNAQLLACEADDDQPHVARVLPRPRCEAIGAMLCAGL